MLLALDIATKTGWALGLPGNGLVASGVLALPKTGNDIGRFIAPYAVWLDQKIKESEITDVVFESPIMPGVTNVMTLRKLYGLTGRTEEICLDHGIGCRERHMQAWRKHFLGRASAPKDIKDKAERRKWLKSECIRQCRARGWNPRDDNEADALGLMDCVLCTDYPEYASRTALAGMGAV